MYSDSSETTGSTQSFTTLLIKTDVTGVSIDAITFDSSLIHWTNPTGYIGVTYNGARIYVNNALIFTSSPTQTSYTLTGLSTNTTYDIEVKAFYSDGSETVGITQTLTTKLGAMDSNIVSTSIKGGGISILYTPSMTEDGNFHEVTVDGTIQELTTNIGNITITDFRSTGQGWDVTVQATPFTEVGGVGYTFPNNSLTLEGINSSSQTLASIESNATVIDSGSPVQIASANTNQGMGKTELTFFNNGLKLFVDTKNKLVDPNNLTGPNSSTPYKSVITWAVSTGP